MSMSVHEFSLLLTADDVTEEHSNALFEAGLDDGTISACERRWRIDISREADSLEDAIRSAIGQVNSVGLTVARVEIEADQITPQPTA